MQSPTARRQSFESSGSSTTRAAAAASALRDKDGAAHHELPHHDAVREDVARARDPVAALDLRRCVARRAVLDVAGVALVVRHVQRHAKVRNLGGCLVLAQCAIDLLDATGHVKLQMYGNV
jgi:hypothetical protein